MKSRVLPPALVLLCALCLSSLQPAYSNSSKSLHQLKSLLGSAQFRQVQAFTQLRQPDVERWLYVPHLKSIVGYFADGQVAIMLEMNGRKVHGTSRAYYKTGNVEWEGEFQNGHPTGIWKRYFPDSRLQWQITTNASKKLAYMLALRQKNPRLAFTKEAMHALKLRGTPTSQHQLLQNLSPQFRQFLFLHGEVKEFYADGSVKCEAYFSHNLPTDRWTYYSSTGLIANQGYYHLGQKHGAWKYFNEHGTLLRMTEYNQGRAVHVSEVQPAM